MDCRETDRGELAEKYLRGELDLAHQEEFEVHILECSKCLQALDALDLIRRGLGERAHLLRGQTSRQRGWFRWQWIAPVPVVLVAGVAYLSHHHVSVHAPQPGQIAANSVTADEASDRLTVDLGDRKIEVHTRSAPPGTHSTTLSAQGSTARERSLATTIVAFEQELSRLGSVEPPPPF